MAAPAVDERTSCIARSLIIKHVVRKTDLEPLQADDVSTSGNHPENVLITDKAFLSKQGDRAVVKTIPSSASVRNRQIRRLKGNLVLSNDTEDLEATTDSTRDPWTCAICLVEYKIGDEICWTRNPACIRVFHRVCIEEWLCRHHDCPVCRESYIFLQVSDRAWSTLENRCLNFPDPPPSTTETVARVQDDVMSSRLEEGGLAAHVHNSTGSDSCPIVTEPLSSGSN